MKRSEMVEIISDYLLNHNAAMSTKECPVRAKEVLSLLEEVGMIPPNQYACTNEFRFEWEDEDV